MIRYVVSKSSSLLVAFFFTSTALSIPLKEVIPLIDRLASINHLDANAKKKLEAIFSASPAMTQGNPKVTAHPMSQAQCLKHEIKQDLEFSNICQSPYMAPIYQKDAKDQRHAVACIDQFEFPNIPCEYPLVWVSPKEASEVCESLGKRLCDASEWEASCAGDDLIDRYSFGDGTIQTLHKKQRQEANRTRKVVWSYGKAKSSSLCATGSSKSPGCDEALRTGKNVYQTCGSNTYPVGAFPECKSASGVYDLHGNAAEHMNLPTNTKELARNGGLGYTEMKGSWFVFNKIAAHQDDCYWRAPFWHGSKINSLKGHSNYHLSFRCCKNIK